MSRLATGLVAAALGCSRDRIMTASAPAVAAGGVVPRRRQEHSGRCRTSVPTARSCRERCWYRRRVTSSRLTPRTKIPRPEFSSRLSVPTAARSPGALQPPRRRSRARRTSRRVSASGSAVARDNLGGTHQVSFDVVWTGSGTVGDDRQRAGEQAQGARRDCDRTGDLRRCRSRRRRGQPSNPAGTVHPSRHREIDRSRPTRDRLDPSFRVRLRKNAVDQWTLEAPVRAYHSPDDVEVPYDGAPGVPPMSPQRR